ncbi:MAG: DUF362 domain-containing protein [Dehalococcoidales bacterium]|nr:DUF362 domain-containing protein [Dehalococcoidales bacterium]
MPTTVAITKTAPQPSSEEVSAALAEAVALAGGLADLVHTGALVLIKPNLLAVPDGQRAGACTTPAVCKAIADLVRAAGGRPIIAESGAVGVDTEQVIRAMGYTRLREEGYEVVDLKRTPTVKVPVPGGRVLTEVTTFELAARADAIISVPVLKTHDQTDVTLSIKNLKGLETDPEKKRLHRIGIFGGVPDLLALFKPALAVVDGIYCQEGLGPLHGIPVEMDLLIVGRDLVAVDVVAGEVMDFRLAENPIPAIAAERSLGIGDLAQIQVVGEPLSSVRRRFLRSHEDERLRMEGLRIIHAEGTCTGCRNGVLSSLWDLKRQGLYDQAQGLTIVTGEAEVPADADPERTITIGICRPRELRRGERWVRGCPPNNADIVQAIVGEAPQPTNANAAE